MQFLFSIVKDTPHDDDDRWVGEHRTRNLHVRAINKIYSPSPTMETVTRKRKASQPTRSLEQIPLEITTEEKIVLNEPRVVPSIVKGVSIQGRKPRIGPDFQAQLPAPTPTPTPVLLPPTTTTTCTEPPTNQPSASSLSSQ